jgi:hypothetical protein
MIGVKEGGERGFGWASSNVVFEASPLSLADEAGVL